MSTASVLLWIFVGIALSAGAEEPVTLREVEEKIKNLGKLEQNVEWLVKEFDDLKESNNNVSEELKGKLDLVYVLDENFNNLTDSVSQLNQRVTNLETTITRLQNELEFGGKNIQTYPHNSK